jgi:hypothetical protein
LNDAAIDSVAQQFFYSGDVPRQVSLGPIDATLPAGITVQPLHRFTLSAIANAFGDRPVYFASSGGTSSTIGLDPYLIRHGLAYKLHSADPAVDVLPDVERMPPDSPLTPVTGDWIDVGRTAKLMDEVFVHRGGIPDWDHWPDHSTVGIPNYYSWGYYALAQAALNRGDSERLEEWRERAQAWGTLGRIIEQ